MLWTAATGIGDAHGALAIEGLALPSANIQYRVKHAAPALELMARRRPLRQCNQCG